MVIEKNNKQFNAGGLYFTRGIVEASKDDADFAKEITKAIAAYQVADWGDTCDEDKQLNDEALTTDDRIVAKYITTKGNIFIITEWDRSATTVLFANEY